MGDSYEINERNEVVPYTGGRMHTDTSSWRDATELEIEQQATIGRLEREHEQLRDGIRALAVKFDRAANAYRKEGLSGQAELWDMAADKARALLREDGQ